MKYFYIETYGCQMNVADSELVASILINNGYRAAEKIDEADIIIFNTCSVREHAEIRVLGRISNEVSRKMMKPDLIIGIIGCMAQRMGDKLLSLNEKIDFVVGVDNYSKIPMIIKEVVKTGVSHAFSDMDNIETYNEVYPLRKADFNAFVTIMRGCDNFCSYCIVPHVRGRERSRPVDSIIKEIETAGKSGYKDVTLLGQNVNSYNYKDVDFTTLLRYVNDIADIKRIRFVTSHPKDISEKLIQAMSDCSKVCEHLHLPLQSGDDNILMRMNRGYTIDKYINTVNNLRDAVPDIALTTDIMVGFPGETEQMYRNTYDAMERIAYDFAFMFKYSQREGTASAKIKETVTEQDKLARLDEIISLQGGITLKKYQDQIGRTVEVYTEKVSKKSDLELSGKTRDFKITVFPGNKELIGSFVDVKIIDATGWTLKGELIV